MAIRAWTDKQGRKRWAVEFEVRRSRVFRRLPPGATKGQAAELETRLRHEYIDQAVIGKKPNVSIEHAINTWLAEAVKGRKSENATKGHAAAVSRTVADTMAGVSMSQLHTVAAAVSASPLSNGTINRRLCVLKAVAKFAWRKGWTDENLSGKIQLLKESSARHRYLTADQVSALLAAADSSQTRAFMAWAVYTGMRQGEIMALTDDDVLDDAIRIGDSKTGLPRMVPIVQQLRPYLSAIPFRTHKRTLYKGFERARDAAGLRDLTYHDLRHTTASLMINAGVPLYVVGELLGHKSVQTTRRYAHLATDTIRDAMDLTFSGKRGRRKAA